MLVDAERWRDAWWDVLAAAATGVGSGTLVARSRHATTLRVTLPNGAQAVDAYVKSYHPPDLQTRLKDLGRPSKAVRTLLMSTALAADGFRVPAVLAAAEHRRGPLLLGAILVTEAVHDPSLKLLATAPVVAQDPRARRALLAALGQEVARLHERRYIHGDMLATNLLVDLGPPPHFCFIDNDRTARGSLLSTARAQRRNLIQLNRVVVPAVTHADRLRMFRSYAQARGWARERARAEARRIARKTLERRAIMARRAAGPVP